MQIVALKEHVPSMKKSSHVELSVVVTVATAALAGCDSHETRRCVDSNQRVVDDRNCDTASQTPVPGTSYGGGHRWYYGGYSGGYGSRAEGGSFSSSTTTSRGIFGSTARSFSLGG